MKKPGTGLPGELPYSLTGSGVIWENGTNGSIEVREVHVQTHSIVSEFAKVITVLDGTGALELKGSNSGDYLLAPGDVHMISAGTRHLYTPFDGTLFIKEERIGEPVKLESTPSEWDSV